ncbi:glycoside hydrolase family 65 protein [Paenibacillus donghaensis]|uniref:glycoside hydrolase family 65 protein n=1 Tax=Paenibacillus donghaensis TaxID=414771 RepID=UPI00188418F1|nr:glycoside hydrolase family 65 protein [Paenibacillus donghaensis]MBE9914708.1 glycoside hydrolase family 65 protein [Paenibacillus donghaensis]
MIEYKAKDARQNGWVISETAFDARYLAKFETIFSQGNGYMGLRAATEESYAGERRNLFVAGTFNRFANQEVTELPNAADMLQLDIRLNGIPFHLEKGMIHSYRRELDLRQGELRRDIVWEDGQGAQFKLCFRRFVSMSNLHLLGMRVEITPLTQPAEISIVSGINGQMTNSGAQHFLEGERRVFEKELLQLTAVTSQSNMEFVHTSAHQLYRGGTRLQAYPSPSMERRKVRLTYRVQAEAGETISLDKIASVHTSIDADWTGEQNGRPPLAEFARDNLLAAACKGYDQLFEDHARAWQRRWESTGIEIGSSDDFDQLSIRFAQYHLTIMTPAHDSRFSIGAKGLTGEGYKGHVFWDTEIFILPYFLYTEPGTARKLAEYRYHTLNGARKNALDRGYRGAMYPWESAVTGEEETPEWGPVDVVTGTPTYIWTGKIEQHITADVAYGAWHYFQATGDQEYMDRYGYEIVMETATFWASRLEWNEEKQRYHITDVIGPDEYKEHVSNNAYTNYMAYWNIKKAIECTRRLMQTGNEVYTRLEQKLSLKERLKEWEEKARRIYLPQPDAESLLIPQDDTYLELQVIDLEKYRNQEQVASILADYSMTQLSDIQVSKQADILVLFYLLEDWFSKEVKAANWHYYEPKTLHDSSLSLSTHSLLACDVHDLDLAYEMFAKAARIDLGTNMHSCDEGIHAASIGGIWKAAIMGFGGVRSWEGMLRLNPMLPNAWERLSFPLYWQGVRLQVTVTRDQLVVERLPSEANAGSDLREMNILIHGCPYALKDQLIINSF